MEEKNFIKNIKKHILNQLIINEYLGNIIVKLKN